jgi:hypothetical protein
LKLRHQGKREKEGKHGGLARVTGLRDCHDDLERVWNKIGGRMDGERDRGVAPNLEQYLALVFLSSPPNECSQKGGQCYSRSARGRFS